MTDPMSDIVVTGGTGFLGRALLSALVREGHSPVALVRRPDAASEIAARHGASVRAIEADPTSAHAIRQTLRNAAPKIVFHLAGGRVASSSGGLRENLAANLTPTVELIEALEGASLDAFVLVSTGEVYGRQDGPFHEDLPTRPSTAYAASKVAAEAVVLGLHGARGLPAIVARLGVVYGPGPWASVSGGSASGMLLPRLISAALAGKRFPMSPGTQTRDFLYVEDAARALIALSVAPRARGRIVNVGAGTSEPVGKVAARLLGELGQPIALELGAVAHAANEILDYRLDVTRLTELTGFSPRWTLEEGIREMARGR